MRTRTRAALAAATTALLAATAAPASAADGVPAGAVAWSARHGTAAAEGHRWTEPGSTGLDRTLVIQGKLSNTGSGCYALWIRYTYDLAPAMPRKYAEVCGTGSVDVSLRHVYRPTTTGYLTVCRGTADTGDCGPWQNITWWPVRQG